MRYSTCFHHMRRDPPVAVVVLGELSRCPRMRNHAAELAAAGFGVVLIGYRGCPFDPPPGVRVRALHPMRPAASSAGHLVFACRSAARFAGLALELVGLLLRERFAAVFVQNPPALAVILAARLLSIRIVVDWHNYGWTLLGLRLGARHWLVRCAAWCEIRSARGAFAHLAVSEAMRADLAARGIPARVLYDRPVEISPQAARPANGRLVAVSPAGWTRDENIGLLLDAIPLLPPESVEFHLTGDGPLRPAFESRIDVLRRRGYRIFTGFLPEPDYRALLRRADIGLSLHASSSGLDLAMKVVDLFAAGLSVCALDYGVAVREQVRDRETGRLFRTAEELAAILADRAALRALRPAAATTWREDWRRVAAPLFAEALQ
jgi:beta-1,4-mannosyltransferase